MKKITCYQYYSVCLPVNHYGEPKIYNYDLGKFVEKRDAIIAGQLFSQAIQFAGTRSMPKKAYHPVITEVLVPESQITPAFSDISDFITSNKLVYNFVKINEDYAKAIIRNNGGYDSRYEQPER